MVLHNPYDQPRHQRNFNFLFLSLTHSLHHPLFTPNPGQPLPQPLSTLALVCSGLASRFLFAIPLQSNLVGWSVLSSKESKKVSFLFPAPTDNQLKGTSTVIYTDFGFLTLLFNLSALIFQKENDVFLIYIDLPFIVDRVIILLVSTSCKFMNLIPLPLPPSFPFQL